MKNATSFFVEDITAFKIKMLNWANRFNIFCLLDNQQYQFEQPAFECLLAAGCTASIQLQAAGAFDKLQQFTAENGGWLFGHLAYDLKNDIEQLQSSHPDGIGFPDAFFFVPEILLQLSGHHLTIYCDNDATLIFEEVNTSSGLTGQPASTPITVQSRMCRETYLEAILALKDHIHRGDCYEINYCQEFFVEHADISPLAVYAQLINISPNPFSAFYRLNDLYCICASPERYIKKTGHRVISQPIKGTASRNHLNPGEDLQNKLLLRNSAKEQSENVMVVDLVRNDLSKICRQGTVHVDELFGIYSFPQVHQMISTVSGMIEAGKNWVDIIKATFPMGSMTGAPKKKVMQLVEEYELTKRGLFSGSIGYITPQGDADFNVVIRSILYNASTRYLSFHAGSAITSSSDPLMEYEECLIKIKAIKKALGC